MGKVRVRVRVRVSCSAPYFHIHNSNNSTMDSEDVGTLLCAHAIVRRRLLMFFLLLRKRMRIRSRSYVTCSALRSPSFSQWNHFYRFADDESFLAVT